MTNGFEDSMFPTDQSGLDEETRSKASAIVAGVLVVIAGFMVYNYFSQTEIPTEEIGEEKEEIVLNEEGLQGLGETQLEEPLREVLGVQDDEGPGIGGEAPTGTWMPRDISANSLSGSEYTVQSGDTLWEIAEGRYGSGFDWGKILEANKDSVGFLPNGSQALIEVGQVLRLP